MIRKSIKSVIRWLTSPKIDPLQDHYDRLGEVFYHERDIEIANLMAERDRLRVHKKKYSHVQKKIEALRAEQLRGEA